MLSQALTEQGCALQITKLDAAIPGLTADSATAIVSVTLESVRILDCVRRSRWNHPLDDRMLEYVDQTAVVTEHGFYHGGDVIYTLQDVPGTWHEACLAQM